MVVFRRPHLVIAAFLLFVACSSSGSEPAAEHLRPTIAGKADLNGLDGAGSLNRVLSLLEDDFVLYTETVVFNKGGALAGTFSAPAEVRSRYPETIIQRIWSSAGSSSQGQMLSEPDGIVLAATKDGRWVDADTQANWPVASPESSMREKSLSEWVRSSYDAVGSFDQTEHTGTDGEYLGRQSVIFSNQAASTQSEFHVSNPIVRRQSNWQIGENGERELIGEFRVVDFGMLPPGSGPE